MYEQSLFKVLPDYIKPKILKRNNKYKKWEYGYNKEHDVVVISKTGKIGEIYEIQNLKIALPQLENVHKFKENRWVKTEYPKPLSRIKTVFDWKEYPEDLRKDGLNILTKNLKDVKKVFVFIIKEFPLI